MTLQTESSERQTVSISMVRRLAMMAGDIDFHKAQFTDAIDQAALREAVELLHAVAMAHDSAGGYGVYADDEGDEGEDARDAAAADRAGWSWHMDLEIDEFNAGSGAGHSDRTEERA